MFCVDIIICGACSISQLKKQPSLIYSLMTLISSFHRWTKFSKTVKYPGGSSLVITENYGNAVDDIDRDISEICNIVDRFVF